MEINKHFSVYDFLGYFIPGALTIYAGCYYSWTILESTQLITNLKDDFGSISLSIAFVISAYTLGHAINYLSSISIEKYCIWMFGYPSSYLLNEHTEGYFKSKKICEEYKDSYWLSKSWRSALFILILPVSILDLILGLLLKLRFLYTNPLDDKLVNIIKSKKKQLLLKLKIQTDNESPQKPFDFHRIINHYYYEKCKGHVCKFDNYVALYGFTRSISFILCMIAWVNISLIVIPGFIESKASSIIETVVIACLSYIFFMAFLKFYRRYTLEGFMCLVIDETLDGNINC